LARGAGFSPKEIEDLVDDARRQLALFCATRVPVATLRELCLSVLLETMSFEFLLSRCSSRIAGALSRHYSIPKPALRWFELHSEVDVRHAEEGLTVIRDYVNFHQISDRMFSQIARQTMGNHVSQCRIRAETPIASSWRSGSVGDGVGLV
jgi:pyrroloquinoline quinone (PQQ) biosynthesis protein C